MSVSSLQSRLSRAPAESVSIFKERLAKVARELLRRSPSPCLIVASHPEQIRNGNVSFDYRQDSNLYYLTGFEEPETILVFRPGLTPESILFVRPKDSTREIWDGFRFGPELTKKHFGVDEAFLIEDFSTKIVELLKPCDALYYRMFKNSETDRLVNNAMRALRLSFGRSGRGYLSVFDSEELLGEFRVRKENADLLNLRRACELTAEAHNEVMKYVRPGMNEREIRGYFLYQIHKRGAAREGYNAIVAGGPNACVLHYVFNDQVLQDGDLLLLDAAGEYNYLTSDITRTFPVNGKFSKEQGELYDAVLRVQKSVLALAKVGLPYSAMQSTATELLVEELLKLGILKGRADEIIETKAHMRYYPHGVGHFLGMDVHDAGLYNPTKSPDVNAQQSRPLAEGMVFTCEPGLYIPADDPSPYRGLGIRIEDDILMTHQGPENLTIKCAKEREEIEALMAARVGK